MKTLASINTEAKRPANYTGRKATGVSYMECIWIHSFIGALAESARSRKEGILSDLRAPGQARGGQVENRVILPRAGAQACGTGAWRDIAEVVGAGKGVGQHRMKRGRIHTIKAVLTYRIIFFVIRIVGSKGRDLHLVKR